MDADFLREAYSIDNFLVLRNLPKYQAEIKKIDFRKKLNIPLNDKNYFVSRSYYLKGEEF